MSLLALERALARAVTEPTAEPAGPHDLTLAEEALLAGVERADLAWVARLLARERDERVAALAPWTTAALGGTASRAFAAFAARWPSREETALRDTSAFLRWLKPRVDELPGEPWLADALAYELAVVRLQIKPAPAPASAADPDAAPRIAPGVAALALGHDFAPLAAGEGVPERAPTGYVLARAPRSRAVSAWRVPSWAAETLARADGATPMSALRAAALDAGADREDFERFVELARTRGVLASIA